MPTAAVLSNEERRFIASARRGHLATADAEGRPNAVPVCYALVDDDLVVPIDEKPKESIEGLRRVRDVRENPRVALVVDHWDEDWSRLGWVQVRGTATLVDPDEDGHAEAVTALRGKYEQYADHDLEERPLIRIEPGSVLSWGRLRDV